MKKFYSLALAVAAGSMALSAQAPQKAAQLNAEDAPVAVAETSASTTLFKAPQKVDGATSIFAEYIYCFKSFLGGEAGNGSQKLLKIEKGEGNAVTISGLYSTAVAQGTYNESDQTIHIPRQILVQNEQKTVVGVLEVFDWSGQNPVPTKDEIVLKYNGGVLSLPNQFTIIGLGSHDGSLDGNFRNSYYFLAGGNFFLDKASGFQKLGDTQFTNNFFCPMFGKKDVPVNVSVYKSSTNGNIFLVEGAFKALDPNAVGQMIIDATNPKIVRVPVQSSGITATDRGMTWYCSVTAAAVDETDLNAAISQLGGGGVTSTGDKIEFTKNACRFNWTEYADNDGKWFYSSSTSACTLNLPGEAGIEDVISDSENAPVEYFNLQGVKIQNPAEGQIVIRRQGSKVTKVVM